MSHALMYLTDSNPNDLTGGGGCICDADHDSDCHGPYIVIPGSDTESIASPHVVVCAECLVRLNAAAGAEIVGTGSYHETVKEPDALQPVPKHEPTPAAVAGPDLDLRPPRRS